jgi:hypothetical protein
LLVRKYRNEKYILSLSLVIVKVGGYDFPRPCAGPGRYFKPGTSPEYEASVLTALSRGLVCLIPDLTYAITIRNVRCRPKGVEFSEVNQKYLMS